MNHVIPEGVLDSYCVTTCHSRCCDVNRDCQALKFLRNAEVRERENEIVEYVLTRHQAVPDVELVERFFLGGVRAGLDSKGRDYLARQFAKRLEVVLSRDSRVRHLTSAQGPPAWASASLESPAPEAVASGGQTESLDETAFLEIIKRAPRPVSLRDLFTLGGDHRSPFDGHAVSVSLARNPEVRCVFLDRRRGIGTHWGSSEWVRARLPGTVSLWPQPASLFQPSWSQRPPSAASTASLNSDDRQEEDVTEPGSTQIMAITVDDVLCGSVVLEARDHGLFPDQPNPIWIEIHDPEHEGVHDGLLLTRGGRRELFGLADLLLEGGGADMRLRLHRTLAPHVVRVEWRAPLKTSTATARSSNDRIARRVWRTLLDRPQGMPLDELAALADEPCDRVRTVLAAFECFEVADGSSDVWRLSDERPGLRRRFTLVTPVDDVETIELARSLVEEARAFQVVLRQMEADVELVSDRLRALEMRYG